jgi:nitrate reductase NapAB chaperone NapD
MPVLSAVLTLSDEPQLRAEALAALSQQPKATVGAEQPYRRLPIVLESSTRSEDKALWKWASALPGVLHTELVFADFSDLTDQRSQS